MPTSVEIVFDNNPKRVYYGGQTVRGKVHLKLAKEKTVRGNNHNCVNDTNLHSTNKTVCVFEFFFLPNKNVCTLVIFAQFYFNKDIIFRRTV